MGYSNTSLVQKLGTQTMKDSGATQGLQLSNLAIRGLSFLVNLDASTGSAVTVNAAIEALERVRVNIDGADDFNMKGSSLYYLNRWMMDGNEVPNATNGTNLTRNVGLYLPFEYESGVKSQDTVLDLRPRANGSLPQAYVQFYTDLPTNNVGSIDVYEHYYTFANKQRKTAFRKQIIEKTLTVTAGGSFIIPIDYGATPDDIARMMIYTKNASGVLQTPTLRSIKLSASEGQQYDVFDVDGIENTDYTGIQWVFNKMAPVNDDLDGVTLISFGPDNSRGQESKLSGVLDASDMTNLTLSGVAGAAGEMTVLLERVGVGKNPTADPYSGNK